MKKILAILATIAVVLGLGWAILPANAASVQSSWHARLTCTTNAKGHCTQVFAHPIQTVPVIQVTSEGLTAIVHTYEVTATTFRVRVMQTTSNPWANRTLTLAVSAFTAANPDTPSTPPTSATPTPSVTPTVQPSVSIPPTTDTPSTPPTSPVPSTPAPDYPTISNTGVPAGTVLTPHSGNMVITTANTVVDGRKISGNVDIRAAGVVIKNSEIAGIVVNDNVAAHPAFTIQDSTVGPATGCSAWGNGAIGTKNYTAKRVHLRGYSDGFRIAGSNVLIQDNFVKLCSANPEAHSDGIQAYGAGAANNIVIDHNVIDQTPVPGAQQTAPIFIPNDGERQGNEGITVTVTNNVLAGGSFSLRVFGDLPWSSPSVSGNKILNNTWGYGPVDVTCSKIATWKDNAVVTYDFQAGKILSQVRSLDDHC